MTVVHVFSPLHPEDLALEGLVVVGPARVRGVLMDDDGFPACVHGGDGVVAGHLHAIVGDPVEDVLRALDLQHGGAAGAHRRTIVRPMDAAPLAWAWHWSAADLPVVTGGDWTIHAPRLL